MIFENTYTMMNEEQNMTDPKVLRTLAEKKMNERQEMPDISSTNLDVKRLVHELQVHQIELEMQNDELREAYETMETALKKYTLLYDFAPTGYFTLDADGTICELNFTGAEMLADKRFALVNSNFKLFIADNSKELFDSFFTKVYSGNRKESCEVVLGYDNKNLCRVYLEGVVTGDDQKCLLSAIDISPFKAKTP
jgi:hypothetical protein